MQAVDYKVEEFFRVLLSVDAPLVFEPSAEVAERGWADSLDVICPETADEVCEYGWEDAIGAFPILLRETAPSVVEEELRERDCGEKALDGCVHIAGYAEVHETGPRKFQIM